MFNTIFCFEIIYDVGLFCFGGEEDATVMEEFFVADEMGWVGLGGGQEAV